MIPRLVKTDSVSPTSCHRGTCSFGAVLLGRQGPQHSLHVPAKCREFHDQLLFNFSIESFQFFFFLDDFLLNTHGSRVVLAFSSFSVVSFFLSVILSGVGMLKDWNKCSKIGGGFALFGGRLQNYCLLLKEMFVFNDACFDHNQSAKWLAVQRAGDRSYVTGSIRGWSRSHLTNIPGGCWLKERKLTSQCPQLLLHLRFNEIRK